MSTIVVVRKGNLACIASDSLIKAGNLKIESRYVVGYSKVQKIGDNHIGILGPAKAYQVVRSYFAAEGNSISPKSADDLFEIVRRMQPALAEAYFLNPIEEGKEEYNSLQMEMLVANPFGIFGVDPWGSVSEYSRFWAKGNGDGYALGSMFSNYDRMTNAEGIAVAALKAAAEFDDSTAEPFIPSVVTLRTG